jgi:hypothetical protein
MVSVKKGFKSLLILVLAVSSVSLLIFEYASAEAIPAPTIPQFTLRYDKASYNTIDPYTGASQDVDNSTINIIVKNQPFNIIYDAKDNITTSLYYNVQFKGHYAENWTEAFSFINESWLQVNGYIVTSFNYPTQSNSDYTTISMPANYPAGSQVDFRVQAVIANQTEINIPDVVPSRFPRLGNSHPTLAMFIIQTSDWSNTETINLTDISVSVLLPNATRTLSIQTPTSTPTSSPISNPMQSGSRGSVLFGFDLEQIVIILLGIIAATLAVAFLFSRKKNHTRVYNTV